VSSKRERPPLAFNMDAAPAQAVTSTALPGPAEPKPAKEGRKQVGARVPDRIYRQLKARAALQGALVQDLVEQAISEYLANHPTP
jgi:hypothetical protein